MQLPNNTSLKNGKYHVVRCLGQGGYGITYLATTLEEVKGKMGAFSVNVPVAIKEFFVKTYSIRDDNTSEVIVPTSEGKKMVPRLKDDFIREAKSMSEMDHPNIVKVIDIFEDNNTVYYVMQYLEGCTLSDKVNGEGPLKNKEAQKYVFQVASALSYLHDQHICHFDVKPSNIMLLNDGKAVLVDFGISRHYDEEGLSTTVRPVGYSNGFSSPEQIMGEVQRFSPCSDLYSLAATYYFAITGKSPSSNNEDGSISFDNCPHDIPQNVKNAIAAGMKTDSSQRPQTIREWLAMLDDSTVTRPKTRQGQTDEKKDKKTDDSSNGKKEPISKPIEKDGGKTNQKSLNFGKKSIFFAILCACIVGLLIFLFYKKRSIEPEVTETKVSSMEWNKKNRYGNTYIYTGDVIDSIPNGRGSAKYSDGSSYEGIFHDGLRDGDNAKYTDPNGNTFTGSFSHDTIVKGRITATDGRYYEGTFSDDKPLNGTWHDATGEVMYTVEDGELIITE